MNYPQDLQPGDIVGFPGLAIVRWKTTGQAGHVVVYVGGGMCVTANPEAGVNNYALATQGNPVWVRRPTRPVNLDAALAWFAGMRGLPYGWDDIFADAGFEIDGKGGAMDCSHTSAAFLQKGDAPQFDPSCNLALITPAHFESTYESYQVWRPDVRTVPALAAGAAMLPR